MVYVFKTTVDTQSKLERATRTLEQLLPNTQWNFDLEDCDNILRIETQMQITELILNNGIFDCVELE